MNPQRALVPLLCLAIFGVVWLALAVAPLFREVWLLENLLTLIAVPTFALTYKRLRFSDRAYIQITLFLVLHTIGSHYTYGHVPLGDWARDALGLSRNPYDRLVHFAFGLLFFLPNRELAFRGRRHPSLKVELFLTFTAVAWWGLFYELLEWWVALIVAPFASGAFLGFQGDAWDAQKDLTAASLGAALAAAFEAWRSRAESARGPAR